MAASQSSLCQVPLTVEEKPESVRSRDCRCFSPSLPFSLSIFSRRPHVGFGFALALALAFLLRNFSHDRPDYSQALRLTVKYR